MLPSRGLRPAQLTFTASRNPLASRSCPSRKFSSLPQTARLSASCRASALQSARWRTGATRTPNVVFTASTVRNGSWYAPWSWGKPSAPSGSATDSTVEQVPIAEFSSSAASKVVEPAVTTATPEIAPAGIDKAPVVNSTADSTSSVVDSAPSTIDGKTMDDLLSLDPTKNVIDPTALINHPGQLYEMGLDYGWGMTTMFEKLVEQIYLTTGWGWAGTILLSAVTVRSVTFVLQALSSDKMAALAALKPLTAPLQKKMEEAIARGDKQQEHMLKMEQAMIMKPHMGGAFAMSGFMLVQMWIGFSVFRFLRALSALPAPGMSEDGFLWFLDLTVPDPYYILPVLTSGLMYSIVKLGGETGVQNDVATSKTRMNLMKYMSLAFGVVTAFQASALQLYFLANGLFGALTGYLLRQNWFRRAINIRILPSRESNELFTKVAEGQVKLSDIRDKTGKIRYQAPTVSSRTPRNTRSATTIAGLKLKAGTVVPRHMKPEEPKKVVGPKMHDDDFEAGAQGGVLQRLDWVRRNYRPSYLMRRTSDRMENYARSKGYGGKKLTEQEEKRKRRAELYEAERKRRFEKR